jgi:mannose-6-phosphate isomerase-like protein (cupin superfamily)
MPIELAGGCRTFELREGEPVAQGGVRVWRQVGRDRGADAISLNVLEVAPGATTAWRNPECDEVLFVVSGSGDLLVGGQRHRVASDTGIFVRPGSRLAVSNPGETPLLLVSSRCPDPGARILFDEAASFEADSTHPGPSMVRFEDQPTERAGDGRWFRVLVDGKSGSEQVTQFVGFIPSGRAPDHFHEYEEVVCILEGEARFWSGDSSAQLGPGSGVYLPRRQPHCLENTGTKPLKLHGLFYPAGSPAVRYRPEGAGY